MTTRALPSISRTYVFAATSLLMVPAIYAQTLLPPGSSASWLILPAALTAGAALLLHKLVNR